MSVFPYSIDMHVRLCRTSGHQRMQPNLFFSHKIATPGENLNVLSIFPQPARAVRPGLEQLGDLAFLDHPFFASWSQIFREVRVADCARTLNGKARRSAPFRDGRLSQAALPAAILRLVELWTLNVRITGSDSSRCRIVSCTFWYSAL